MKKENICTYCGDVSNQVDHIIPLKYLYGMNRRHINSKNSDDDNLTDCCKECNLIAGSKVFDDIIDKKYFIQERLKTKYYRLLRTPDWTDEEIASMGHKFRNELRLTMLAKKWIINRINYPDVIYELPIDTNCLKEIIKIYGRD